MWSLDDLRVADAVMTEGNFSGAARRLGVTRSAVSKAVRRLEDALEVQLFLRDTHEVRPTDAGRAFHGRAMFALTAAEEATALMRERRGQIIGTVRVSLPTSIGFA
jgi:DNA-binding transcriptional LysR family regulator